MGQEDRRFESSLGIDTFGRDEIKDLTVADGDAGQGVLYAPEAIRIARWWRRALPPQVHEHVFIDMGSGKGRVLFFAAQQGFKKVVGVEFAEELHRAAASNVARATLAEASRIDLILGDAGRYAFPPDPLVVHFNNPFKEGVMREVIDHLSSSYREHPRPVIVIYEQHRHEPPETKTDNVALLATVPFLRHRRLPKDTLLDRLLLRDFLVDVFESPEAITRR